MEPEVWEKGCMESDRIRWCEDGRYVKACGRVIIIHTPPTKSGKRVMFITLEDARGLFDVTVFENVSKRCAKIVLSQTVLVVEGVVNRFGLRGVSILARNIRASRRAND
ncbi:nucleic acid binding OB-fold tRNA/helicase-type [Desulfatibacillum aliphaticivorans]|uniref:Nucleic acid binding OB-fold tRNA/helicase-type n=1 Tax=Desulfatibacillum aliphaticivorans TaxID=218208 RepID=B8FIX6_DESAL|nr:OB-fold nucleic acid binding domain-containing protein [Desulfatibacillum aliphaticivorans]ACL04367.1 nucleic acid binding OB-fold tRNA/helicase-type [Desulfatibacillum aliphaticivorans]